MSYDLTLTVDGENVSIVIETVNSVEEKILEDLLMKMETEIEWILSKMNN